MARYRIQFSRDWLRGRWGYIDRIFFKLGGRETEPSRTEDAWLVEFKGKPKELGNYLTDVLDLKQKDFRQFGSIFEITEAPASAASTSAQAAPRRRARPVRRRAAPPGAKRLGVPSN